jgi:lipoate-protein ligase A
VNALGRDLVQHETNGTLCELVETAYADVGNPVNVLIRTGKLDGGTINLKRYASLEIIGNKVAGSAYVRHSGDDYVTYTKYRPVDLNAIRSVVRRLGADRRRSYDIRYLGSTSLQLAAIDVEVV